MAVYNNVWVLLPPSRAMLPLADHIVTQEETFSLLITET